MDTKQSTKIAGLDPEKQNKHRVIVPLENRLAYTPTEFAALFGRAQTWGYRKVYSGRVKAIRDFGRLMISRSEVDRLTSEISVYEGRK